MVGTFRNLFKSEAFWMAVLDAAVLSALFLFGKYAPPDVFETIKFLVIAWQPIVALVIASFTIKGVAKINALGRLGDDAYVIHDKYGAAVKALLRELADKIRAL